MSIWVKCMYVYGVWMCVREFWSVHAFYGAANALYWKCLKRQNSTYLTLLKHQNTKTSLYKLSKNHWVITLLENFGSVRRKLQSTVFLDHPVGKRKYRKGRISNRRQQWVLGGVCLRRCLIKQHPMFLCEKNLNLSPC